MYTVCINAHADIKLQGCGDLICVPAADMDSYITKPGLPPREQTLTVDSTALPSISSAIYCA